MGELLQRAMQVCLLYELWLQQPKCTYFQVTFCSMGVFLVSCMTSSLKNWQYHFSIVYAEVWVCSFEAHHMRTFAGVFSHSFIWPSLKCKNIKVTLERNLFTHFMELWISPPSLTYTRSSFANVSLTYTPPIFTNTATPPPHPPQTPRSLNLSPRSPSTPPHSSSCAHAASVAPPPPSRHHRTPPTPTPRPAG